MIHSRTLKALLCISSGLDNRSYDESSSAIVDRFSCSIIQSIVNTTIAVTAKSTNQQLSITLRNLSNQLFLDHYGDFKRNVVLQGILQQLEVLENLQLRLFGLKLLTAVLQNTYMDARFELKAGSLELNYTVEDDKVSASQICYVLS